MSATVPPTTPTEPGVKTFRGESLEELLPQIRAELGPDAVILRQRDGLKGGVGGFFQKRCVEVDARAGAKRVDTYAGGAEDDPSTPLSGGRWVAGGGIRVSSEHSCSRARMRRLRATPRRATTSTHAGCPRAR